MVHSGRREKYERVENTMVRSLNGVFIMNINVIIRGTERNLVLSSLMFKAWCPHIKPFLHHPLFKTVGPSRCWKRPYQKKCSFTIPYKWHNSQLLCILLQMPPLQSYDIKTASKWSSFLPYFFYYNRKTIETMFETQVCPRTSCFFRSFQSHLWRGQFEESDI